MKHKLFDFPHRAIRNIMFKISSDLSICEGFDGYKKILSQLYDLQFLLDNHLITEDEIIVPNLSEKLSAASDDEHHEIEHLQHQLFNFLYQLNEHNFESDLCTAELMFNHFVGKYLLHMHHEETEFQNYIWENYSEKEQEKIVFAIVSKFTVQENLIWMKYGLPMVHQNVRIERLKKLKPVFSSLQLQQLMEDLKQQINVNQYFDLSEKMV